ncbi:Fic family protein [Curtobacterium sp. NPDC090217]|uniref:Fic family protein n=1 Tax=Curtobacterium sp. NPDC090217 TaxID=3363970 RepID=UPI00381CD6F4
MHQDTTTRITDWPRHERAERPWRSGVRGPRADRLCTAVTTWIPPRIATARYRAAPGDDALLDRAVAALRRLDREHGTRIGALGGVLARTEAVASSRIEDEHAGLDDYARAVVGVRANDSATVMVAATRALDRLVTDAASGTITADAVRAAHLDLMRDDPLDGRDAGRYRTVQNWIGGGSSPRLATYVPPPPDLVPEAMADLLVFLARDDLHPVAQAAIAHAQFESIHPFTDGNGRIGRALIGAVLRRRGVSRTTVPIATALVADRSRYFDHLVRYRFGSVHDFVADLAIAIGTACDEAALTALVLDEHAADAARRLPWDVGALFHDPVMTEDDLTALAAESGRSPDDLAVALDRAGIIRSVTSRRRRRAWLVTDVATEVDAFAERVRSTVDMDRLRRRLDVAAA